MASPFERKKLTSLVEQLFPVKMGLFNLFFKGKESEPHDTKEVGVEIVKGTRGASEYSVRGTDGVQVENSGYMQFTVTPPYISEKKVTTAGEMYSKDVGDNPYKKKKQRKRALKKLGNDFVELKERVQRAKLLQVASVLDGGKLKYKINGKEYTIDFKMPIAHIIKTVAKDKFGADTSNPIALMREDKALVAKTSGVTPDTVVMDEGAIDKFFENKYVQAYYDNRKLTIATIKLDAVANDDGLVRYGTVLGMELYAFEEYVNKGTTKVPDIQPIMPSGKYFMGSSKAKVSVEYGALPVVEEGVVYLEDTKELSYVVTDENSESMVAKHKTAPCVALSQSDAFLVRSDLV
jgi:hypothetical protein